MRDPKNDMHHDSKRHDPKNHDSNPETIPGSDPASFPIAPVVVPIYQSTTYAQRAPGEHGGYTYTRVHNPTVTALESALARLEQGDDPEPCHATAYSTGMAAITTLAMTVMGQGGHAVCSEVIYGGSVRLFEEVLSRFGVEASFVDTGRPDAVASAMRPDTRLVLVETPGNPTLHLTDLDAVAEIAHAHEALLAVDNTFLTAALQRPLEHGADVVMLSTTKFLEGHNAALGGALIVRDGALHERLDRVRKTLGTIQTPFGAWVTLQGLKTLSLRMARHSETALAVARWLDGRANVDRVLYPGLESFPQHELARRQQLVGANRGGGLVTFELENAEGETALDRASRFLRALRVIRVAENLGAVETLATHSASMTHGDLTPERRARLGIGDGLIRLSIGLESPEALIGDLERGFRALAAGPSAHTSADDGGEGGPP